jgi:hypothetical protein
VLLLHRRGDKDLAVAAPVSNRDPRGRRLQPVALLATPGEHPKLKALAHEILNLAGVIALRRQGLSAPPVPMPLTQAD